MSPIAEKWEQKAAEDLVHFIELMTDVKIPVIGKQDAIDAALESNTPLLIIGREAINANLNVFKTIEKVLKKNPQLQTDGVVLIRKGNHIYLVGSNDRSHYYAVVELLRRWGCRWYMPTGFGECIPDQEELSIGNLSHVYSSMSVTQINIRISGRSMGNAAHRFIRAAHGIRHSNRKSFIGDLWYRNEVELNPEEIQSAVHIRFPSLFNECWLYVNGEEVAHHKQGQLWWLNDYRFEWDVDLTDKLEAGRNILTLHCNCEHHLGGMFRRPFLHRKTVM